LSINRQGILGAAKHQESTIDQRKHNNCVTVEDQSTVMAPAHAGELPTEEGEQLTEENREDGIQTGKRHGPHRIRKPNTRLAGPEWAK